ncbi:MAG: Unknown protein [uncultured Sulfurovum sp.]|uniref:Caspase family p20 domain-containing protein n=1 Tax=uncultured Sulfurovum sp. TaxID=269237 RepID=A0A6S6SHB6_9BACT|nr:MAG: Unknown protein [uncultured Sulfurovum sp.]
MRFGGMVLGILLFMSSALAKDKALQLVSTEMQTEKRVALVIGNNAYQRPLTTLNNTINDAKAIQSILKNRGFKVIYRENISHRAFDRVLEEFYQQLAHGGVGLLYFSGHGLEFDGQNYLIPTDAKIGAKSDTQYEAIALNKITHRIQKIGNRLNIVILDACRNDPFAKAYGVGGLAKSEPIGLFVSYATGAGKVSSDGRVGGNGLFTQYLIENMKKPLSLQQVFKATRASVYNASGGSQFPAIYDQIVKGDFYFTLPNTGVTASLNPVMLQPLEELTPHFSPNFRVFSSIDINKQNPINATINIENQGVWQRGMQLPKGTYTLSISANNYKTQQYRVKINSNQGFDFQLQFILPKLQAVVQSSSSKWIDPTKSSCESNGGKIDKDGVCKATWKEAKSICRASGGVLPSKEVLEEVVSDCGGILNNWEVDKMEKNRKNSSYQACYTRKGFNSYNYWSSTSHSNYNAYAWIVNFSDGFQLGNAKNANTSVRCVRAGQ